MDYPAAHWIHLCTTNAIESTFATVKARTRTTKGAGSRNAGLAMAFKLLTMAEKRWRKVNTTFDNISEFGINGRLSEEEIFTAKKFTPTRIETTAKPT